MSSAGPHRRLVLLRHGETDHNAGLRMQGQLDVGLNDRGREQAVSVAPLVAALHPELVVSSDLARAADTAAAVAVAAGLQVRHDERLRETLLGDWQGLSHTEVEGHTPGGLPTWRADALYRPPGGETRVEVAERGAAVVDELPDGPGTVVLVAHGGLVAALTARLLELPVSRWSVIGGLGNTRWAELVPRAVDGRAAWRLEAWDTRG